MRRSPRVLLAWVAAAIVMLVTMRVVAGDLGALHRRAHALGPDIPVVLAARDLPLGATVGVADVRVVRRPARTVAAGAMRDLKGVVGRIVAVALLRDDVVGARRLVARASDAVPDGDRAVHVVVKDGFEPPVGAVVDVLASYDPTLATGAGSRGEATVVARGARVLGLAGKEADPDGADAAGSGDTTGAGMTVLVTEGEARAVAYAASIGAITLALAPVRSACCGGPPSSVGNLPP
jgi:Flp pilus assembly protein CpaB